MGFLRKVGRKIKKGVKKLFSSKIGAFLGSIALSMIMGPVISKAFNGIKGVFTGAAQAGTQAATTAAGTTAGTAAGTTAGTTAGTAAGTTAGTTAGTAAGTTAGTAAGTTAGTAATEAATTGIIDNTVTGVMEKTIQNDALTNDLLLQAQEGLKGSVAEGMKAAKEGSKLIGDMGKEELAKLASEDLTVGQNIRKGFREMGLGAREFAADPFGKTKEYVGKDFIPDVTRSVGTSLALGAIQGEPEQPFISGGVAPQPAMEASQNAYMTTVQNQIPNLPVTNFQQLNQSLLYGTLSPQYLMGQAQYS